MPSKPPLKTYGRGRPKKIDSDNYTPKPVSPFKITEASTAIDALLSKNIRKRNSSNIFQKNTRFMRRNKVSELPAPIISSLLNNDSLNVEINSTFDNLFQGSVYNHVNVCNKSSLYAVSTDTSDPKNISIKVQSNYNIRQKKKKNYAALHSDGSHITWENSYSKSGKIKKRKNNPRKLKQIIKKVVINISDTTTNNTNISKKVHSYLDKSLNYSLVIDRQLKPKHTVNERTFSCAKKFTPIASTSRLLSISNHRHNQDSAIFRHGFRHLMRADNTPRFIHSSTPIMARNIRIDDKLNVSPITASVQSRLNFTANNSKSLYENKKLDDISSIQNSANNIINKNSVSNVILINSTIPETVKTENKGYVSEVIINDTADNNSSLILFEEGKVQSKNNDKDKMISENRTDKICDFIANDTKLNRKAFVLLERHLDILGINHNTSVICRFPKPKYDIEDQFIPVVCLERLSISKYLKNRECVVNTHSRNNSKNSQMFERSQLTHDKISDKRISKVNKRGNSDCKNSIKSLTKCSTSRSEENSKINSKSRILESQNSVKLRTAVIVLDDIGNMSESMFSSQSNDIIENSIIDIPVPKNFVTTRKKVQINIKPITHNYESKEKIKPLNNNSTTWERFYQCRVLLERMEDCNDLKKYSHKFATTVKPEVKPLFKRKTYAHSVNDNINNDLNRKSIYLKPGKKWFRSLSILRRTNIHEIHNNQYSNKGRKWRDSVCDLLDKQDTTNGAFNEIGDESVVNDMKQSSLRATFGIRKSLKIVNISANSSIITEESVLKNTSGYVSPLAHVSILESFDKLSLSTNVDDREETARQIVLKRCGQTDPIPFDDCYSSRTLKKCRKIGEGVYGEVFMYKSLDNKCRVMKLIPIEGSLVVNGERQKKFEEIISEIIIASELSNLRTKNEFCTNGFAELLQIHCIQGKYPQHLLDLWDLFDEERGSENDSPEIFTEDQLYIVLELANGGQDLESYRFSNAEQSYALFVQVVCSLAVAESALQFEHRDMHWGNILISPTDDATTTFRLKGRELEVATKGVKLSIIDFTLSRLTYNSCCIYNDLAEDPDLFTATGDYQFDIYRLMKQRNLNEWQSFEPYTNILWLDYTLEKMIGHVRYLRETTKTHKLCIRRLSQIRKKILNYNSATELLNSDVFSHVFL